MFCSNCNAIISKDAVICYSCGQKVSHEGSSQEEAGAEMARKVIKKKIA